METLNMEKNSNIEISVRVYGNQDIEEALMNYIDLTDKIEKECGRTCTLSIIIDELG